MDKFLVSVDESGERLKKFFFRNNFSQSDFNILGVDGRKLNSKDYYDLGVKKSFPPLSPSELGCTLSHLKALSIFLESKSKYAVILEDDVLFKVDIDFDEIDLENFGSNFIFLLGGVNLTLCKNIRGKNFLINNINVLKVNKKFRRFLYYTMGYIVDRKAALNILEYHRYSCKKADDWAGFSEKYSTQFYISDILDHPDISDINLANSSIGAERLHHFFYIRLALNLLFKILNRRLSSYLYIPFFKKFKE
ncbi:glycosyltransferase family 25 protein [Acinetobacter indicus]|uniref:glycosyltransferase family 25 protein n=1 Tax=Acinetobacter indicus TaxID=756892 RepID=UPI0014447CFF|nr:glycosyltransferase family 25 protein [Acinetobacter indicus]